MAYKQNKVEEASFIQAMLKFKNINKKTMPHLANLVLEQECKINAQSFLMS